MNRHVEIETAYLSKWQQLTRPAYAYIRIINFLIIQG